MHNLTPTTGTEQLGQHQHHLAGTDTWCHQLTHCPALCSCPVDGCTATQLTPELMALLHDSEQGEDDREQAWAWLNLAIVVLAVGTHLVLA